MAQFDPAITLTLQHEGGYVDNPADKGKATKFGITQADLPDTDIQNLTIDQAKAYYQEHYWKPFHAALVDQDTCNKIFDMGVLFGIRTAARIAQVVLSLPITLQLDDATEEKINATYPSAFILKYKIRFAEHARWIPTQDSTQEQFLQGWLNRINS